MSRIFIKNVPKEIKETRLRSIFSECGTVTDCSLQYKHGKFRGIAFIGFATEEEAQLAVRNKNNTYIDTKRIGVSIAGDHEVKYDYRGVLIQTRNNHERSQFNGEISSGVNKKTVSKYLSEQVNEQLESNEQFKEFVDLHKKKDSSKSWRDEPNSDNIAKEALSGKVKVNAEKLEEKRQDIDYAFEGESDSSDDEKVEIPPAVAEDKNMSDMEYLRMKTGKSHLEDSDEDVQTAGNSQTSVKQEITSSKTQLKKLKRDNRSEHLHAVHMTNLPQSVQRGKITDFFVGLKVNSVIFVEKNNMAGTVEAIVDFNTAKDQEQAVRRSKSVIGGNKIRISKVTSKEAIQKLPKKYQPKPWELKANMDDVEPVAESGRLFVRNLAYVTKEEDLKTLFGKYGAVTDVSLPIDRTSKRSKGFAHISFLFPGHSVKAMNELDGKAFQGRILQVLPGKPTKQETDTKDTFKSQREKEKKAQAASSHNWNTLFLGGNAVANVMADKYGVSKSQLLDAQGTQSLGVMMALGETEVVSETRDFLCENGVHLDAFSQAAGKRSNTVILVKNLPAGVKASELQQVFGKFGSLGRVVMPPAGITALVEFMDSHEAKQAFTKLAYTRFQHIPLYLEWAPMDAFTTESTKPVHHKKEEERNEEEKKEEAGNEEEKTEEAGNEEEKTEEAGNEEEHYEGCTVFVKNLNFTTDEEALKRHFESCGSVRSVIIARKKDAHTGQSLSMGYGFVEFKHPHSVDKALKTRDGSSLANHHLELKRSERTTQRSPDAKNRKHADTSKKQQGTKILVRNIPFQANLKEISELFQVFGELKLVRLPLKVGGKHRGFGFVDFVTKHDAKRAFNALCHSTHLYNRRLVLEWADAEESMDKLRKKTAAGYSDEPRDKLFKGLVEASLASTEDVDVL